MTILTCRNLTTGVTTVRTGPGTRHSILTDEALYTLNQVGQDSNDWSIERLSF
jgi:hypothetical protein